MMEDLELWRKLTVKQRAFLTAVSDGTSVVMHRCTVEPIEGPPYGKEGGLIEYIGGIRVAGCNGLWSRDFALTAEGWRALDSRSKR